MYVVEALSPASARREESETSVLLSLQGHELCHDTSVSSSTLCDHLATHVGTAVVLGKLREVICL